VSVHPHCINLLFMSSVGCLSSNLNWSEANMLR
jgi:hypothetical protein